MLVLFIWNIAAVYITAWCVLFGDWCVVTTAACTMLIDWLIDYDGFRWCLRTAATSVPIAHPHSDMWAWIAMVMMVPAGDNSWLVHQSSLANLPVETSGANRRNGRRSENFTCKYLNYLEGSLTCRKMLRLGTSDFTSHLKEGVLRIFIALKIHHLGRVWTRDSWVHCINEWKWVITNNPV
jgi:hypothetical protein